MLVVYEVHTGRFTFKKPQMYSPENKCPTPFFDSDTCDFATRLLCALAKTSPDVFFFLFVPDFLSVEIFSGNVDHLGPIFFGEKKRTPPPEVRPRDGHVEHGRKVSGPISQKRRGRLDCCVYK